MMMCVLDVLIVSVFSDDDADVVRDVSAKCRL
jgi:hypothetical protein